MQEIFMPKMGDAMTEGKVIRWYKKPGDPVKKGEPVLEIETDKVNLDLEAEEDGVLDQIEVEEGSMADVGATLATMRAEGDAPSEKKAAKKEKPEAEPAKSAKKSPAPSKKQDSRLTEPAEESEEEEEQEEDEEQQESDESEESVKASRPAARPAASTSRQGGQVVELDKERGARRSSPLARKMARQMGVELGAIRGSGPSGRIVAADVEAASKNVPKQKPAAANSKPAPQALPRPAGLEEKEIPLSAMRRTIAKRLVESIGPIPHFYLTIDVDVTNLLSVRAQLNEIEGVKTSVNDFVIRAAALAVLHHPNVNASFTGESIKQHGQIHIGVAVATPEGLITPIVRDADSRSVAEIAEEVKGLAERAKNRKLKPDEYQGSTLTISNLGMFGVEEFTAIINPPNAAILAIGAASQQAVVVDGQIVIRDRMKITMSCDHRVIDGAAGAEYLRTLRQYLEQPLRLVV